MAEKIRPKIGIGVYILNDQNHLLLMLRQGGAGAGTWCPPGGHLEMGEEFMDCVVRETMEEVGLTVKKAELWVVNNNIMGPDRHYVNLDFVVTEWEGEPKNLETEKCEKIQWFPLNNLPSPLMEPPQNFFSKNPLCLCQSGKKFNDCHGK